MSSDNEPTICDTMPSDKATLCKKIIEDHAGMNISTQEAEAKLSELQGEPVVLVKEPDWKMIPQDKDLLEGWASAICLAYTDTGDKVDACVDELDKMVKRERTVQEASSNIGKLVGKDAEDVENTIMTTIPTVQKV